MYTAVCALAFLQTSVVAQELPLGFPSGAGPPGGGVLALMDAPAEHRRSVPSTPPPPQNCVFGPLVERDDATLSKLPACHLFGCARICLPVDQVVPNHWRPFHPAKRQQFCRSCWCLVGVAVVAGVDVVIAAVVSCCWWCCFMLVLLVLLVLVLLLLLVVVLMLFR